MTGKTKYFLLQLIVIVLGMALLTMGVSAYYASGFGSDPPSVFIDGIHNILNVSYGVASWVVMGIMLLIVLPFGRQYIGIGTLVNAVLMGFFINLFQHLFTWVTPATPLYLRVLVLLFGILGLGSGLGIYIAADLGAGPLDIGVLLLAAKLNKPLAPVRLGLDLAFATVGFLLGGVIGLGTIAGVACTGFIIQFFIKKTKALLAKVKPAELQNEASL